MLSTARVDLPELWELGPLYGELTEAFASAEEATVIVDRRVRERRAGGATLSTERRRADRRMQTTVQHQLRDLGWALVRYSALDKGSSVSIARAAA